MTFLLHNLGGKMFEEVVESAGVAYGNNGSALSGMGADFRDVNTDGNNEFESLTVRTGLASMTSPMSGWGDGMVDFDNDGWKDLFVARPNVLDNVNLLVPERRSAEPNSVFRNLGNDKFEDVSATAGPDFQTPAPHRGVAFGEIDNDGCGDVVIFRAQWAGEIFPQLVGDRLPLDSSQSRGNEKQPDSDRCAGAPYDGGSFAMEILRRRIIRNGTR